VDTGWIRGLRDDDVVHEDSNPLDQAHGYFRIRSFEWPPYAARQLHCSTVHMHVHTLRNRRTLVERLPCVGEDLRVCGSHINHSQ